MADNYVCDGATIECPFCTKPEGTLMVTSNTIKIQDKNFATAKDNQKLNLVFEGNCTKSPFSLVPCLAAIVPGEWEGTGDLKVQGAPALLESSTILCNYGRSTITDTLQVHQPTQIQPTDAPVVSPAPGPMIGCVTWMRNKTTPESKAATTLHPHDQGDTEITEAAADEKVWLEVYTLGIMPWQKLNITLEDENAPAGEPLRLSAPVDTTGKAIVLLNTTPPKEPASYDKPIKLKATVTYRDAAPMSATVLISVPNIVAGWWSEDAEGEKKMTKAKLGDTVYFQVAVENIPPGREISLQLWERDHTLLTGWIDPDDSKFPKEEVTKTAVLQHLGDKTRASVELLLDEQWEVMLQEEDGFSEGSHLELYWAVSYKSHSKHLPQDKDEHLRVTYSDRNLYITTPTPGHKLPEFISYGGDPMLLVAFTKDLAVDQAAEQLSELAERKLAFAKLPKSTMADSFDNPYSGQRLVEAYKDMYHTTEQLFESVATSKTDPYTYVSKSGKQLTLWGMVKHLGSALDVFTLMNMASGADDSLPVHFGPLQPLSDLAGILVQPQKAELDKLVEASVQLEVDLAKLEGLEATRKAINRWNHNEAFRWELMAVSKETANKLLQGGFKTFEELYEFNFESNSRESNIEILYRAKENKDREKLIYVIEAIFINE